MPCPVLIFSQSDLLDPGCWYKFRYWMPNSADPDQLVFRSQLIWIYTVCKGRIYPGSAGAGQVKKTYEQGQSISYKLAFACSEDSVFVVHQPWLYTECPAKTLTRLCGCSGWSESSLGAHAILQGNAVAQLSISCLSSLSQRLGMSDCDLSLSSVIPTL